MASLLLYEKMLMMAISINPEVRLLVYALFVEIRKSDNQAQERFPKAFRVFAFLPGVCMGD